MEVLVAPDSFKGSISAFDAAEAIRDGLATVVPDLDCRLLPLADGGEGTLQIIAGFWNGRLIKERVPNATGKEVWAKRGCFNDGDTAVIELAEASGIAGLVRKNPRMTSTFGTGLQIWKALEEGVSEVILTLGGSATVDGGTGLMAALGCKFFDENGALCTKHQNHLFEFVAADLSQIDKRLLETKWTILADVTNPLVGPQGGFRVFGPQKGVDKSDVLLLEDKVCQWAKAIEPKTGENILNLEGVGAAGGAALPLVLLSNATIYNGFEWISKEMNLDFYVRNADLVITGEGKIDEQTFMGKGPGKLAALARKYRKKVVAIAGSSIVENISPFDAIFTMDKGNASLQELMSRPYEYLKQTATRAAKNLFL
ncbi:glycerate kinase family protein [Thermophagus sp. OGC60D27]|uniref:glycerate kinase family protein n=1 Tax=Thermophagus sp. OGC60D27 TaxID=3458415 RepID=UPI0040380CB4